jgi:predicted nucleic acid-binding protein
VARIVLLDSGPLGEVTHPESEKRGAIREWLFRLLEAGPYPRLPEIVDYEHRRALLRRDAHRQVESLDGFKRVFGYEPLTTEVMLTAAELWANARKRGLPTGTERELDVDVILAAQARVLEQASNRVIVTTTNPRHLSRFVDSRPWQEIEP